MKIQIGVIGAGFCGERIAQLAEEVGSEIAERGAIMLCGGLGGVMEAAARGCRRRGGMTIGILPGARRDDANAHIDIVIVSGMGHARNAIIAQSCDALIAVGGEYGTLSEIALSLKSGKPVVTLASKWNVEGVHVAQDPQEAVTRAFDLLA